jgi:hypothetical protein
MSGDRTPSQSNPSSASQSDNTQVNVDPAASPLTPSDQETKPDSEDTQAESDPTTHHGRSTSEVVDEPE